jgi:hypothetical protein
MYKLFCFRNLGSTFLQSGNFLMIVAVFATALQLDDDTAILLDDKEKETVKKVESAKIMLVHPKFK